MPIEIPDERPRVISQLRDGSEVLLSPLGPDDRDLIIEGMDHLSIESRFTRFGQGLDHLSSSELDYLTNIDQRSHVALAAAVDQEPAGVGRYILLPELGCAELAVTVVDAYQGVGLGRLLLLTLAAVARADGLSEFCFGVMPSNDVVRRFAARLGVELVDTGNFLEGRISIAGLPSSGIDEQVVAVVNSARD